MLLNEKEKEALLSDNPSSLTLLLRFLPLAQAFRSATCGTGPP